MTAAHPSKIIIFYTDAGGGHKSVSEAIQQELGATYRLNVEIINIFQIVLNNLDLNQKLFNTSSEMLFNKIIVKIGLGRVFQLLTKRPFNLLTKLSHQKIVRQISAYINNQQPTLVISAMPLINRHIAEACDQNQVKMITVVTDFCCRPGFNWIYKKQQHRVFVPTDTAYQQAIQCQIDPTKIQHLQGLILQPRFYQTDLQPSNLMTGAPLKIFVVLGALGSSKLLTIAKSLSKLSHSIEVIFACGHNTQIKTQLESLKTPYPKTVHGFVDTKEHLSVVNLFIGKPGPTCVTEALIMKVPMILEENCFTLEQEHSVVDFVTQHGYGVAVNNFRKVHRVLSQLLQHHQLDKMQSALSDYHNHSLLLACEKIAELNEAPAQSRHHPNKVRRASPTIPNKQHNK